MIDHVSVSVSDYARGKDFYLKALAPLGYAMGADYSDYKACGLGQGGKNDFWVGEKSPIAPAHMAFLAKSKAEVDGFHAAALAAGGTDNGAPGPRPDYGPNYYAAFVFDPDGNNIEAVFRG